MIYAVTYNDEYIGPDGFVSDSEKEIIEDAIVLSNMGFELLEDRLGYFSSELLTMEREDLSKMRMIGIPLK